MSDSHRYAALQCPVCLARLDLCKDAGSGEETLTCPACSGVFPVIHGVPQLLVADENRQQKEDEMFGEAEFAQKTIPHHIAEIRNRFVDRSSQRFLDHFKIDLSRDKVLCIGGSFPEILFFGPKSGSITGIDISTDLVTLYANASKDLPFSPAWYCGDAEALPFEEEQFDTVIVRQTLHHLMKYDEAIREMFRVCRVGGRVLLIEEPFSTAYPRDGIIGVLPDSYVVLDKVNLGYVRQHFDNWYAKSVPPLKERIYLKPDPEDIESYLTDKYLNFSLIDCIYSLRRHTEKFRTLVSENVAWIDFEGDEPVFRTAPQAARPWVDLLCYGGWVSFYATKTEPTRATRDRKGLSSFAPQDSGRPGR